MVEIHRHTSKPLRRIPSADDGAPLKWNPRCQGHCSVFECLGSLCRQGTVTLTNTAPIPANRRPQHLHTTSGNSTSQRHHGWHRLAAWLHHTALRRATRSAASASELTALPTTFTYIGVGSLLRRTRGWESTAASSDEQLDAQL